MRKLILTITLLSFFQTIHAWHIVGGELELLHLEDFNYQINLIQYFDRAQTQNPGPEQLVIISIFRNSDHTLIRKDTLQLHSETDVSYTNDECAIDELVTTKVLYKKENVFLDPEIFNDSEGYYIVWERCCRNAGISNIVSPGTTGMTYVLDFPPVVKNGEPFVDSTPTLLPPLSDYACTGQLYYADFRGHDADGDSLVYSLVAPLNSSAVDAVPSPTPKPHYPVIFAAGISENNMVPGSPNLSISNSGFLTVNPSSGGLFVFSVKVEQYRDQQLIGTTIRDFQMFVRDDCEPPDPPIATVQVPGDDLIYEEEVFISYAVAEEKCFDLQVANIAEGAQVSFRLEPLNFQGAVEGFSFMETPITEDSSVFEVCIPECPLKPDEPYIINMIVQDDACPLPQQDTVKLILDVEPPPNAAPRITNVTQDRLSVVIDEDLSYELALEGVDDDNDTVHFELYAPYFSPEQFGMSLQVTRREEGEGSAIFEWDTNCLVYDFSEKTKFELGIIIDDLDFCKMPGDTLWLDMEVILPPNTDPVISADLNDTEIDIGLDEILNFNVNAIDTDGDSLNLLLEADGFNPAAYNVEFEEQLGVGQVGTTFRWDLDCNALNIKEATAFTYHIIANDNDKCKTKNFDTLTFTVNVIPRPNDAPEFEVLDIDEMVVNQEYEFDVNASDPDGLDSVFIDLLPGQDLPPGFAFDFTRGSGFVHASSKVIWTPTCQVLDENFTPKSYDVIFLAFDDACPIQAYDTMELTFTFKNLDVVIGEFNPPNVFTPNGDNINDTYSLSDHTEPKFNLPPDNCFDEFIYFSVMDRSGVEVFKTSNRDFVWDGDGLPSGVYYYYVKYANSDFRGTLSILH